MSIEKRNDGYTVRWRDASGRQRSQQVRLWRDAVALDGETKRLKALGELALRDRGSITLTSFWNRWWPLHSPTLSASAQESYEIAWRCHIKPRLGGIKLNQLTGQEVMVLSAGGRAPATIRKHYTVLQAMLSAAVAWGYVPSNVAAGVKKPPLPQSRGVALSVEQVEALVKELPDLRSQSIVRLLAYTGLRPGELRNLMWQDHAIAALIVRTSKTGHPRRIELTNRAVVVLHEWKLASGRPSPWQPIFAAVHTSNFWSDSGYRMWVKRVFSPAASRAGFKGLRVYDLRHTFVSQLIESGADIYWIARQAGHSPEVALRTYAHLIEGQVGAPGVRLSTANTLNP